MRLEVLDQAGAISGATLAVAERVDLQHRPVAHAERVEHIGGQGDHLDIAERIGDAQQFDPDLMELAQPTLLRALVAEHRAAIEDTQRQPRREAVRDEGADDAGGVLRAQRQPVAAPVREGVHLLGDDVGGVAERPREHLGELEDRRRDLAVAVAARRLERPLLDQAEPPTVLGQQVTGAAHRPQARHRASFYRAAAAGSDDGDVASRRR